MSARRILFSAQRNEGPCLLEWIAYHKVLGFTDIILFSNDCSDGSDALLDRLAAAGEIDHHIHTPREGVPPQQNASRLAHEKKLFRDGDWVMWLDLDEYLVPNLGDGTLEALFREAPPFSALLVAWRVFGDGGNATWPGRQISEDFTRAEDLDAGRQPYGKTLFRWTESVTHFDIHRPHFDEGIRPRHYPILTSTGDPVRRKFYRSASDRFNRVLDPGDWWKLAQVNHYVLRTPDLFRTKMARGRGNRPKGGVNDRHNEAFYRRMNRNDTEDRRILRHEAAVTEELARLDAVLADQPSA